MILVLASCFLSLALLTGSSGCGNAGWQISAPNVNQHIPTWGYDGLTGGQTDGTTGTTTNAASTQHIRTWLTYADSTMAFPLSGTLDKAWLDCVPGQTNCIPVLNVQVGKEYTNGVSTCHPYSDWLNAPGPGQFESAFSHSAFPIGSGNRVNLVSGSACGAGTTIFYDNWIDANVQSFWQTQLQALGTTLGNNFAEFVDTGTGCMGSWKSDFNGVSPVEMPDQPTFEYGVRSFFNAMHWANGNYMGFYCTNIHSVPATSWIQGANNGIGMLSQPNMLGGFCDTCISAGTTLSPKNVGTTLATMSIVTALYPDKVFILQTASSAAQGSITQPGADGTLAGQIPIRLWNYVALMLGINGTDDKNAVAFTSTIGALTNIIGVWPEQSIVPLTPVTSMQQSTSAGANTTGCTTPSGTFDGTTTHGPADLVVACGIASDGTATGIYMREFKNCYVFGVRLGGCAYILNATQVSFTPSSSTQFLATSTNAFTQTYLHMVINDGVSLVGGDVLTAGCGNAACPNTVLNLTITPFVLGSTALAANSGTILVP
jgi:hypothetical protein